jgi:hypothetical protein
MLRPGQANEARPGFIVCRVSKDEKH